MNIQMMAIENIKYARFNPKSRIDRKNLRILKESIEEYGILTPLALSRDLILADGHRRIACAKELGLSEVPVIVHDLSLEELWKQNETTRSVTATTWWEAVVSGYPMELVPTPIRHKLEKIKELIGEEKFEEMGMAGTSPGIYTTALYIRGNLSVQDDDDRFLAKLIVWLNKHKQQFLARSMIRNGIQLDQIVKAVETNKPIKRVYLVD